VPTKTSDAKSAHPIDIPKSILERARANDSDALQTMFRQFIAADEEIVMAEYFGVQGLWWVGRHSFACLTDKRIASLMVGSMGELVYQDGFLEHSNSGIVHQPGLLGLYITVGLFSILALVFTFGIGLILLPFVVQWYYRLHKCGLVWIIREGVAVYLFTNRKNLSRARTLSTAAPLTGATNE
jgi:hypothetical protein